MKKTAVSVFSAICLLFAANVASANDSVGLQAGPAKAVIKEEVRQGDIVPINQLFIQNTGSLREKFEIITEGGMHVEKQTLTLQPNEKVFLEASIRPDFNLEPGQVHGKIMVSATEDEGKGINHNPSVELQFIYYLVEGTAMDKWLYITRQTNYLNVAAIASSFALVVYLLVARKRSQQKRSEITIEKGVLE